jgi:ketosteroid isomerase-like protein
MSQENVDAFKRGLDAYNRRDIDALLEELDSEVEWHPALAVLLGGEQTVFRGHRELRESIQEEYEALAVYQFDVSEIRDLGNMVLAIGRIRARGRRAESSSNRPLALWPRARARRARTRGGFASGRTSIQRKPSKPQGCGNRRHRRNVDSSPRRAVRAGPARYRRSRNESTLGRCDWVVS